MLWALALLLSAFPPPSSAAKSATRVVVLEHSGAGTAPEAAVERLGGRAAMYVCTHGDKAGYSVFEPIAA